MKSKIAVTVESDVVQWVDSEVESGRFRNRSHGFEYCARFVRKHEGG